ncbi:hypothetical protein [Polynucleobacter arcticus]|uniref:Lipoprotein n=1 Tax=Polynucleobacter arcticus TaxID=1743165 RepID=A0A6M9PLM2_9BURK|nr:hypothetical protein [Polynucleobacter arcticus]QKM60832.1 hypothetical protein DN92_07195 [Polynucleobacter arcticus]
MININRRLNRLFLVLAPLVLTACASQSGIWVKSGTTPLQFNQDNYACLQESQQPFGYGQGGYGWGGGIGAGWGPGWGGFNGYSGVQTNQELYSACMRARDYSWQPDTASK